MALDAPAPAPNATTNASAAAMEPSEGEGDGPLTAAQIEEFVTEGYCLLEGAFPRDVAAGCRSALWRRLEETNPIFEGDPSSWAAGAPKGRLGIAECYRGDELGADWSACWSARLRRAVDQLCGRGRWVDGPGPDGPGCGWWVVTFPGFSRGPWGGEGAWHVDGHGYDHRADSPEIGCLPVFLFSDVARGGGGTAIAPRSHAAVAELLVRAGERGVNGPRLSSLARETVGAERLAPPSIVETRGRAGDVMLTHPFLLHARSKNLREAVRFMCHPAVRLRERMRAAPADPTPVERVVENARRDLAAAEPEGIRPLPCRGASDEADALRAAMGFAGFGGGRAAKRRRA